jgi:uncharacterized protein with PIN domain
MQKKSLPQHNLSFLDNQTNFDPFQLKFICDGTTQRLMKHLRMLGCNCKFQKDATQNYILYLAQLEDRIILTKSRTVVHSINQRKRQHDERIAKHLAKSLNIDTTNIIDQSTSEKDMNEMVIQWMQRKAEMRERERQERVATLEEEEGHSDDEEEDSEDENEEYYEHKYYFIKATDSMDQIDEVVNTFKVPYIESNIFSICLLCNHPIIEVEKETVKDLVYPTVYDFQKQFYRCTSCQQIYWGKDTEKQHVNFLNAKNFAMQHSYHPVSQN